VRFWNSRVMRDQMGLPDSPSKGGSCVVVTSPWGGAVFATGGWRGCRRARGTFGWLAGVCMP
ncbi:MAG TPA: hypothetical protein VE028_06210, partial [Nitratidesulfovibrio sp.]|nr:hypothetical protein [Nitratidesulfovibrio sp.]